MTSHELSVALKRHILDEGFDAVGIAATGRLDRDTAALDAWLDAGHHATLEWMQRYRDTRADPTRLLPGCRSVAVVAMSYWPGEEEARTPPGHARVALYARGRDYHKVMGKRLKRVGAWLEAETGAATRTFVDTGPVLERGWAQRAGLGWIGKNANLLTRAMGSWLLLGELLTTAELDPDDGPHADHCGTCTACVEACPTDAIVADGVVDSRACISYWTIEHRGEVPEEKRAGNADWIFGCDICQRVCPWNETHAHPVDAERFERRDDLRGLDPLAILAMDEATFRATYSGTPLMRAKWEGMRRNACIVLGNRRDPAALELLHAAAREDPDPVVRSHAAWAIERISGASG
ncbi:MAG: tRNA epoxyqueuosine(34) reductase QueG [Acidobacteria bacterium]|nr:tRNA epoxyqueuosine(34) reductase QueG [Acidobacteriota bacterium]NIM62671.1 tRNA epoxyqueuosine(34) reductase QueG [Acidobacteriota bacterium]NIO59911.1 tRNA epoxyqueuosine(34) reductase QueG [Acidobacteriota bacterium]NIQ86085.1 tRNA epoxyqueuosine(34) reductase QueG [Acidobacteriota bacterium]NIT11601.1 tRNA epoxyqueuosine(34) reductase QueG [Acidobacteriota bacterium]